jgi:hypothetical protein
MDAVMSQVASSEVYGSFMKLLQLDYRWCGFEESDVGIEYIGLASEDVDMRIEAMRCEEIQGEQIRHWSYIDQLGISVSK